MEWILVLWLIGGGRAIEALPYTYSTYELCQEAVQALGTYRWAPHGSCLPKGDVEQ
jgi:hypothetical protein